VPRIQQGLRWTPTLPAGRSLTTNCLPRATATPTAAAPPTAAPLPCRLRLHRAWWSSKPRNVDLTVATGLTPTRLGQLEAQCLTWKGPLSAAVYLVMHDGNPDQLSPLSQESLQYATNHVQEMFD